MHRIALIVFIFCVLSSVQAIGQENLSIKTPFVAEQNSNGMMFTINALQKVEILQFETVLSPYSDIPHDMRIYWMPGSYIGFEQDESKWTMTGYASGIKTEGGQKSTLLPIPVNVVIPKGQSASFYITTINGGMDGYPDNRILYGPQTGEEGEVFVSDDYIELTVGYSEGHATDPFVHGMSIRPRNWTGVVYYKPVGSGGGSSLVFLIAAGVVLFLGIGYFIFKNKKQP